jgi:hypothetical protein
MAQPENDIVYEKGIFWVHRVKPGKYQILRTGLTYSTIVGWVTYTDDDAKAIKKAIAECDRRAGMVIHGK